MNSCLKHLTIKTDEICSNCDMLNKCIKKMQKKLDRQLDKAMVRMVKKIEPNYEGGIYNAESKSI
jgi:hypothetical protein